MEALETCLGVVMIDSLILWPAVKMTQTYAKKERRTDAKALYASKRQPAKLYKQRIFKP